MMYINPSFDKPKFRMEAEEYNKIVNSITNTLEANHKPVRAGLVVRTTHSNRLLINQEEDEYVLDIEIDHNNSKGYFSIIHSIRNYLLDQFGNGINNVIPHTVLMPVGVYEQGGNVVLYFNLIIEDDMEEYFRNTILKYNHIDSLRGKIRKSDIVLPTLTLVQN